MMLTQTMMIYLPFLNVVTLLFLAVVWTSEGLWDGIMKAWLSLLTILHFAYLWPLITASVRF